MIGWSSIAARLATSALDNSIGKGVAMDDAKKLDDTKLHPACDKIIRKLTPIQEVIDSLRDQIDSLLNRNAILQAQVRELRRQLDVVKRREKERKAL